MKKIVSLFLILCFVQAAIAQADCPAIVTAAIVTATESCAGLERNQACYGNVTLAATPRADAPSFTFDQAGDVVNVADIESLRLSSMSLTDETWGVALMQIQANLPDTLPGQNVTLLLFGEVVITDADTVLTEVQVTANSTVNVRLRPTTAESNVIASLASGQTVTANGRLFDGSWVRIVIDAETGELGWVSSEFVSSAADLNTLNVVDAGSSLFTPMQAFYFSSGIGDRPCTEAPDSGILIQTPEGVGEVNMMINEVSIRLGSTIYVQAGGSTMFVSVVEGHAVLNSNGVSQTVPAGTYSEIPLNNNGSANGAPSFPQPYNYNNLLSLPVSIALPQTVSIAQPLPANRVQGTIDLLNDLPPSGTWQQIVTITEVVSTSCPPDAVNPPLGDTMTEVITLTFSADRSSLRWRFSDGSITTLSQTGSLSYHFPLGANLTFNSLTTFTASGGNTWWNEGCYSVWSATGTYTP
jgi:hypothetical protein